MAADAHWHILARKYDGSEHYRLPARLVAATGDSLTFVTPIGGRILHQVRGQQTIQRESDLIFWRAEWYNVYLNHADDGSLDHAYCNITLPPVISDAEKTLVFVDLDLDVRVWPDGRYAILDMDEFRAHGEQYQYPPDVRRRAYEAVLDILIRWRARQYPFDRFP